MTGFSVVDICNAALAHCGEGHSIGNLQDDVPEAEYCREAYPRCRLEVLGQHNWNFATKRARLALSTITPAFRYEFYHVLPVDFLHVTELYSEDSTSVYRDIFEYEVESVTDENNQNVKMIASDSEELYLRYVSDATDTNMMSPLFRTALEHRIAAAISTRLTQSGSIMAAQQELYERTIRKAKTRDAQSDGMPRRLPDTWVLARRS